MLYFGYFGFYMGGKVSHLYKKDVGGQVGDMGDFYLNN